MYSMINKVTPDTDGVSKSDLNLVKKYATTYVTSNLRLATNPLTDEIRAELEKLMDEEAEGIKKWNREQRDASRK